MITLKFHFGTHPERHSYILITAPGPLKDTDPINVVQEWSRSGYSVEEAQNKADRFVGEAIRRKNHGTGQPVICVYTKEQTL